MKICKSPCKDCPFAKTSLPGWIGTYNSPYDLHNLVMSENPFPCHLSHEEEDISFDLVGTDEYPYCKGAILYMKKACKMPRDKNLFSIMKEIKPEELENILSVPEFCKHHSI